MATIVHEVSGDDWTAVSKVNFFFKWGSFIYLQTLVNNRPWPAAMFSAFAISSVNKIPAPRFLFAAEELLSHAHNQPSDFFSFDVS